MDATKLIGVSRNGKLTVDVPKEFDNKEIEIMIVATRNLKPGEIESPDKIPERKIDLDDEMI